jgi:putative phosphoesterase
LANFKKAIAWIKKEGIKTIIHCGDIFKPETIKEGLKDFEGEIHLIFSPADADFSKIPADSFKGLKRVKIYEKFGNIEKDGKRIAFCHFPEIAKELTATQKYDLVFYGHTHKPWEEKTGKARMVNPGNIANILFKPTFDVYDTKTDKLELKILERLD